MLKARLDNLDGLDPSTAALYRQEGEGEETRYVLDVETVDGFGLHDGNAHAAALQQSADRQAELALGLAELRERNDLLMIETEARVECAKRGGSDKVLRPHFCELLMVHNGQVVARGPNGKPRQTEQQGFTGPMLVVELFNKLEKDPDFGRIIAAQPSRAGSGTGAGGTQVGTRRALY